MKRARAFAAYAAADYLIEGIEQGYDREALLAMREDIIAHTVITRETCVDSDGDSWEYTWEYDGMGNKVRDYKGNTYEYDSTGRLVRKTNVSYNYYQEKGIVESIIGFINPINTVTYICNGGKIGEYTNEYDSLGNVVHVIYIDNDGDREYIYEYDSLGNMVRGVHSDGYGYFGEYTYTYEYAYYANKKVEQQ